MLPGAWASRPQGKGNHEGCPYYDNPNPVHIHHPVGAVREPPLHPHAFGEVFTPSVRYPSPENFQQFYCQYLRCIVCLKQLSCPLRGTHNDENRCRVLSLRPPLPARLRAGAGGWGFSARFRPATPSSNTPKVRRAQTPVSTTGTVRGKAAPAAFERRPSFSAFFLGDQEKGLAEGMGCGGVGDDGDPKPIFQAAVRSSPAPLFRFIHMDEQDENDL